MKIWLDDMRPAPEGFVWCRSVNEAKRLIHRAIEPITLVDCDHDLGDYACDGGDGIKLLDWLAETRQFLPVRIHTMNPVGRQHRCGSGRCAAAQYQQDHQKVDGEISSGGRYITCRRMRFIGGVEENAVTARFLAGGYDLVCARPRPPDIHCGRCSPDPTAR